MIDSKNPETIEIHGYNTINKLCKFAADRDMEGCKFTDIVDRALNEINALKAQLEKLNEGWLMVPKELNTVAAANIANTIFTKNESYISNENRAMTKSEYQNFKERWIAHKAKNIQQNYKELIKAAQENSHE